MPTPSVEYARSILKYDPETGLLTWKRRSAEHFASEGFCSAWNRKYPGRVAGSQRGTGYLQICIDNRPYPAHRIAWLLAYGEWPKSQIDHINCDKSDNRLANLRVATTSQNQANKHMHRNNKAGMKGVYLNKKAGKYAASAYKDGTRHHLWYFDCPAVASFAYQIASDRLHGEFARAS